MDGSEREGKRGRERRRWWWYYWYQWYAHSAL